VGLLVVGLLVLLVFLVFLPNLRMTGTSLRMAALAVIANKATVKMVALNIIIVYTFVVYLWLRCEEGFSK